MFLALVATEVVHRAASAPSAKHIETPNLSREMKKAGHVMQAKLTISPTGKTLRCDVLQGSDLSAFDDVSCAAFMASTFKPAVDQNGNDAYGVVTARNLFIDPGKNQELPPITDLQVAVSRMPQGAGPYAMREAVLTVDAAGNAVSCDSIGKAAAGPLDKALCKMALGTLHFAPALDEAGNPVPSVQSFSVMFTAQDGPAKIEVKDNPHAKQY